MKNNAIVNKRNVIVVSTMGVIIAYLYLSMCLNLFPFIGVDLDDKLKISNIMTSFVQVLFFVVTAIIAILSYRQAKQTLFNPIRTEIFKLQVEEYQRIVEFFRQGSFIEVFDYNEIVKINAFELVDDYAIAFFKTDINEEKLKELRTEQQMHVVGVIISNNHAMKNLELIGYDTKFEDNISKPTQITNPALILKQWESYEYCNVKITDKFHEKVEYIAKLINSPILPRQLVILIEKFNKMNMENMDILAIMLTEKAQIFPTKYPAIANLKEINMLAFFNEFNHRKNDLEVESKNILNFINHYFQVDDIIN